MKALLSDALQIKDTIQKQSDKDWKFANSTENLGSLQQSIDAVYGQFTAFTSAWLTEDPATTEKKHGPDSAGGGAEQFSRNEEIFH